MSSRCPLTPWSVAFTNLGVLFTQAGWLASWLSGSTHFYLQLLRLQTSAATPFVVPWCWRLKLRSLSWILMLEEPVLLPTAPSPQPCFTFSLQGHQPSQWKVCIYQVTKEHPIRKPAWRTKVEFNKLGAVVYAVASTSLKWSLPETPERILHCQPLVLPPLSTFLSCIVTIITRH